MKITWMGHSCFAIEKNGFRVLTDPFEGVPGLRDIHTWANAVYCSHDHHDHHYLEGVDIHSTVDNPFHVATVNTFHDAEHGELRGKNTIYSFEADGVQIVHLGDLGHALDKVQADVLSGCDVLMIPVGGTYTIDGAQAARTVAQLHPRIVIPMHYRNEMFGFKNISTVDPFLANVKGYAVKYIEGSTVDTDTAYNNVVLMLNPEEQD